MEVVCEGRGVNDLEIDKVIIGHYDKEQNGTFVCTVCTNIPSCDRTNGKWPPNVRGVPDIQGVSFKCGISGSNKGPCLRLCSLPVVGVDRVC